MATFFKKCIDDHRCPIVKTNFPPQKRFFVDNSEEEKQLINFYQESFKTLLEHQRVEKRCVRAQAVWLLRDDVIKLTKVTKNLMKSFGNQNKNGVFIYPEEMLFLLETNRLEVKTDNGNILSIEKAYEIVFKLKNLSLTKYRIYKTLASLGYKLIRFEQIDKTLNQGRRQNYIKRSLEEETSELQITKRIRDDIPPEKSAQLETNTANEENVLTAEHKYICDTLNRITRIMPTHEYDNSSRYLRPGYCIFAPGNLSKHKSDFCLHICEDHIPIYQGKFKDKIHGISASCVDDTTFYRFSDVYIPVI